MINSVLAIAGQDTLYAQIIASTLMKLLGIFNLICWVGRSSVNKFLKKSETSYELLLN